MAEEVQLCINFYATAALLAHFSRNASNPGCRLPSVKALEPRSFATLSDEPRLGINWDKLGLIGINWDQLGLTGINWD
eukprot:SAG31_NODE_1533_length_7989_cov_7.095691_5_plen_78_part_00